MTEVRLPRLLDDNLLEVARLHPDRLSIDLSLSPLSTASMSVAQEEATISVGQFVELFTAMGSAGVFLVKTAAYDPDTRKQDVTLEHGLATLANNLMEGDEVEKTGTARQLLEELLSCQSRRLWVLGNVEVPDTTTLQWTCDYSNVLQSIVNLMEQLPAYMLQMDQSSIPWTLSVVPMPTEDGCECRLTRNLESLTVDVDRTDLCTRLYIRGMAKKKYAEEDTPLPADDEGEDLAPPSPDFALPPAEQLVEVYSETLEADTIATWGIVERVLEADMELPREELRRQGKIYLEERKNPAITITMDAFDLYRATGEAFDRFYLGRVCRVCLPEYGVVLRHRVVALTFPDALGEPERVTVTLAAKRADGIDTISGVIVQTAMMYDQIGRLQINKIVANGLLEILADQIRLHAKHILLEADKIELIAQDILLQADKIELIAKDILLQADTIKMVADEVEINAEKIRLWGEVTDELEGRTSRAEINIDANRALIELKASQEVVDELGTRMTHAEIAIDGANARIDLVAGSTEEITELATRVTSAEIAIDGLNGKINLKASQSEVDALSTRLSNAEVEIDGANSAIALKASQSSVDSLSTRLSNAEIEIDGANSAIALKASQSSVDSLSTRLSNAEIEIDGANSAIALKASQSSVDSLSTRLSNAEVEIDGANSAIALKANASTVTALGTRVSAAEIEIDGLNSEIALKADTILLQGYVKASSLRSEVLEVLNASYIETLAAGFIGCGDIDAETVNCDGINTGDIDCDLVATETLWVTGAHVTALNATDISVSTINGYTAGRGSVNVVVTDPQIVKASETITYLDGSGSAKTITVVTGVALQTASKVNISYLQLY